MEKRQTSSCCGRGSKKQVGKANQLKLRRDSQTANKNLRNPRLPVQSQEPEQVEAKIVLIGDMAVGKSSIAGRFNHGDFKDIYQNTIGGAYF